MQTPGNPELVEVNRNSSRQPRPVRQVADLAARQDGVVGHEQLHELGFPNDWIDHQVETGRLHVIFRGAYAVGHKRITWRGRLRAAILSCGPNALISHRTAAALHGLRRGGGGKIHVTVPGGGHEDRDGIVLHRVRRLPPAERTTVDGIPATSVARTCLDMAAIVRSDVLTELLEAAERNKTFDLTAMLAVCGRGREGSKALKRALSLYQPIPGWTRSRLEKRLFTALRKRGAPLPGVNLWVEGQERDLVWHDQWLVVEVDGDIWHATTAAKTRDPRRDAQLQIAGYATFRAPENGIVHDIAGLVDDIVALLRRPWARTPARPDH
jgi:predicted transcriptional regulator of viral defense system